MAATCSEAAPCFTGRPLDCRSKARALAVIPTSGETGTNQNWIYVQGSNAGDHFAKISAIGTESYGNLIVDCYGMGPPICGIIFNTATAGTQFVINGVANTVNQIGVTGAPTGSNPMLSAGGADTNVGLTIRTNGTGGVQFSNTSSGGFFSVTGDGSASEGQLNILGTASLIEIKGQTNSGGAPPIQFYYGSRLAFTAGAAGAQMATTVVADLQPCTSSVTGATMGVTDASSPTWNGTLTGGGSTFVLAVCNGSAWTVH